MCNLVLFVAVNALYSGGQAYKFDRSVRWLNLGMWTCWNTVSPWSCCSTAESLSPQLTGLVNSPAKPSQGCHTVACMQSPAHAVHAVQQERLWVGAGSFAQSSDRLS